MFSQELYPKKYGKIEPFSALLDTTERIANLLMSAENVLLAVILAAFATA
jgi:hypothetical protein